MISRQPDIGLRQYRIALAQDRLLAPLVEKYTCVDQFAFTGKWQG